MTQPPRQARDVEERLSLVLHGTREGQSARELASVTGLTERSVVRVRKRLREQRRLG